jgi:hypothetical protein
MRPMPLCACGCGQPVKRRHRRWLSGHVPPAVRGAGGVKSAPQRAYTSRRRLFERVYRELIAGDRCITRARLFAAFQEIRNESYQQGYSAFRSRLRRGQISEAA